MADEKIGVEVVGKTDQLQSSMNAAGNSVQSAMDRIRGAFSNIGGAANNMGSVISGIAGGVIGGVLVAAVDSAIGALKNLGAAFVNAVNHARDFALENQKAAAILGTSYKEAAAINMTLGVLGKSMDDYSGMILKMQQRLKQSEDAWRSYGMATRDANGNLLQGRQLMQSAITTMQQYKTGADQNAFALEVFGRSAAQVYDYMRMTDAEIQQSVQLLDDFGIRSQGAAEQAAAYANAMDQLGDIGEAFATMIGERMLPTLTSWAEALAGPLQTGLQILGDMLLALISIIEAVAGAFQQLINIASGAIQAMGSAIQGVTNATSSLLSGDFTKAGNDITNMFSNIGQVGTDTFNKMGSDAARTQANLKALWGDFSEADKFVSKDIVVPGKGGDKSFTPAPKGSEGGAAKGQDANAQVELYRRVKQQEIQIDQQTAQTKAQIAKQSLQNELQLGKISQQEYTQRAKEIANQEYQAERQALERKAQLAGSDVVAKQKALDDIKLLELKHQGEIQNIEQQGLLKSKQNLSKGVADVKSAEAEKVKAVKAANDQIEKDEKQTASASGNAWKSMTSSIGSSFGNALKGMIHGTMTWKEALGSILDSVVDSFIDMGIEMLTNWIQTSIEKMFITKATESATAASQISAAAGVAGANAFASTAAIPVTGPAMAPAAGAAAVAQVMGYQGLAFAEKGMVVDRDRLVFAHKDEQILPANIAKGMTNIINNGGDMSKGGDTNLTYSPTVNSASAKSLEQQLKDESRAMLGWLMAQKRNGALKFA